MYSESWEIKFVSRDINWQYCPECRGSLVEQTMEPDKQIKVCSDCGLRLHRDPKVAVAAIVQLSGAVLLVKRARHPMKGYWCLPGGFVDLGETLEEAVVREATEETGLATRVSRLWGLYSYTGYPVVVAIYELEFLYGDLKTCAENLDAQWFAPAEIPWGLLAFPSTKDSLETWAAVTARNQ